MIDSKLAHRSDKTPLKDPQSKDFKRAEPTRKLK